MSSVYAKFIAEAGFKHTVDKPHTSNGLAFYEEPGRISHRVDLDSIWTDSKYIPLTAPKVDENGFYYAEVGASKIKVLQKLENIPLDKVEGTDATYSSIYLVDAIFPTYGTGYSVTLTDWNGEEIPFGLNQWVIDPDNGELSFLGGWPEGYQENPKISFYRYVGKKAPDSFLRSDGSVQMIPEYIPVNDQDIATKKYVDDNTKNVAEIVDKLVPTLPPTLDNAELTLEYARDTYASPWNDERKLPLVFYGEDFKVNIPQFYNPGKGEFSIYVNNLEIAKIDLSRVNGPEIYNFWTVTSVVDPYRSSKVANGFYKSINSYITFPVDVIKSMLNDDTPYITIYCSTYYDFTTIKSRPITIGFEEHIERPYLGTYQMSSLRNEMDSPIKYVSGVPTLREGSTFEYDYILKNIHLFKNDYIGKLTFNEFYSKLIETPSSYPTSYPKHYVTEEITIPSGLYIESLIAEIKSNDVTLEDNIFETKTYNIRVDTVSDESNRKVTPSSFSDNNYSAIDWSLENARQSLIDTNELQMLNGVYCWPHGNYTDLGNFQSLVSTDTITLPSIGAGPNYDVIVNGVRYVTFAFDMPFCNGFWVSFDEGTNIVSDKDTHAFKNISQMRCLVEGQTGWLDMRLPYEGVLCPREESEGCLVVPSSTEDTKYITFGPEGLDGRLCISIGITKESAISFKGIKIVFNT